MTLDLKALIIVVLYAVISNLILVSMADSSNDIVCYNFERQEYDTSFNTSENYTADSTTGDSGANILKLMLNRCSGFPYWIFLVTQIPTILGVLYLLRAFIGFT